MFLYELFPYFINAILTNAEVQSLLAIDFMPSAIAIAVVVFTISASFYGD